MPAKLNRACLVVFSGGQDSTTCLYWARRAFAAVEAVFFDYGQRHRSELLAAQIIAWKAQVPLRLFRLDFFRELKGNALTDASLALDSTPETGDLPNTFVPGRNLLFLTQAAAYAYTQGIHDLVTGICQTDYSGYPDCREETRRALQRALHLGLDWQARRKTLRLHAPLMFKTKAESIVRAREWGALEMLAFTHTCYAGTYPPCGRCAACRLRAKGFAEAGVDDPLLARVESENGRAPQAPTESKQEWS